MIRKCLWHPLTNWSARQDTILSAFFYSIQSAPSQSYSKKPGILSSPALLPVSVLQTARILPQFRDKKVMEIVDDTIHVVVKTCQDHFRSRNPNQHNQSLSLRKTTSNDSNGLFKDAGFDNKSPTEWWAHLTSPALSSMAVDLNCFQPNITETTKYITKQSKYNNKQFTVLINGWKGGAREKKKTSSGTSRSTWDFLIVLSCGL